MEKHMKDNDKLFKMLLTFYASSKEDERNIGSRKVQLISNSIFALTFIVLLLTFTISQDLIKNWILMGITIFILLCTLALFVGYTIYIRVLNNYQKIHLITSIVIEKKLFELLSEEKKDKKELLQLFPRMRLVDKDGLLNKDDLLKKWFHNTLKRQNELKLYQWLNEKIKKKINI
jgi:hypothetical protein